MADLTKEPLLDLDTLVERRFIKLNGQLYEMRNPEELSPLDHYRIANKANNVHKALESGAPDQADALLNAASRMLDEVCREVLVGMPEDVHQKLNDAQRIQIATVFLKLQREHVAGLVKSVQENQAENARAEVETTVAATSIGEK